MSDVICRLPNGCTLYKERNGVGGHRYWSDEVGGGVMIWDTCLVDPTTLLTAIVEEHKAMLEGKLNPTTFDLKE
jgi:hypothetical protein